MVYVRVTGRAIVNVHSANAEGAVGNYTGLSKMSVVRRAGSGFEVTEDAVISGNMMKHWHAVRMVELLREQGYRAVCDNCSRFIMYRAAVELGSEYDYIKSCAVEDVHGFLQTEATIRRESIAKFAFWVPVEDMRSEYRAITHNRVYVNERGAIPRDEQEMMVIKREYASGVYGFLISLDLAFVGRALSNPSLALPIDERKVRAVSSVLALADLLTGRFGAASSRAIPIVRVIELMAAVSESPLPNLVHGFYMDYAEESARILKFFRRSGRMKVFAYGDAPVKAVQKMLQSDVYVVAESPYSALVEAASVVEEWLK